MKIKALRTKKEPKEFVELNYHNGTWVVYTSELPNPQPVTATPELMKEYFTQQSTPLPVDINLDDYELVEFDVIERGVVGEEIRNRLVSILNLIALCELFLKDEEPEKKGTIKNLLKSEIKTSKICIKHLANMF